MHRAFSSVSAASGVTLEANVRNLPTLLSGGNGQIRPAGERVGRSAQGEWLAAVSYGSRAAAWSVVSRSSPTSGTAL